MMLRERRRVACVGVSVLCKDSIEGVARALTRALAATVRCAPEPEWIHDDYEHSILSIEPHLMTRMAISGRIKRFQSQGGRMSRHRLSTPLESSVAGAMEVP